MNENATFFRNRKDLGETYQFSIKNDNFSVYCRRPLQAKSLSEQGKLYDVVATKGGGGVVVTTSGENGRRMVDVKQIGDDVVAPAGRFVILTPGSPAQWVSIASKHKLLPGTHAIVPIDADAEKRLAGFVDQLPWFSPDFEALVLNAIRRPSLDARLSNVETRLFGQSTAEEPVPRGWRQTLSKPVPYMIGAVILLILLQSWNGYQLWNLRSKATPAKTETATETARRKKPNPEPEKKSATPAQEPLVTKTKDLLDALRESEDPEIKKVYELHFQSSNEKLTDDKIKGWFDGKEVNRPLLWGILKLQALALHPDETKFVPVANAYKATRTVIEKSTDANVKQLSTALLCRLTSDIPNAECETLKDDAIANGLTRLIEFVKNPK